MFLSVFSLSIDTNEFFTFISYLKISIETKTNEKIEFLFIYLLFQIQCENWFKFHDFSFDSIIYRQGLNMIFDDKFSNGILCDQCFKREASTRWMWACVVCTCCVTFKSIQSFDKQSDKVTEINKSKATNGCIKNGLKHKMHDMKTPYDQN